MKTHLVSAIITTKNSSRTLERCLQSLTRQTYTPIEIIVVDNNSTDATLDIANKYAHKVYTYGPERSAQRNYGAKQADGEYLLIHDSDIYFHPNSVQECVDLLTLSEYDAAILPERSIGEGYWAKVKAYERSYYMGNPDIEAARFFRADVYNSLHGYDESLTGPEDWELTIRLRRNGHKIGRTQSFLQHDEGRINLLGSSRKKKYYSTDMYEKYARRYPKEFQRQMSFTNRFPIPKLALNTVLHPILTPSMLLMKGLEYYNAKKK